MNYLNNMTDFLKFFEEYKIININIWRIILAILMFSLIMLLRCIFRRFFVNTLKRLTIKYKIADTIIESLKSPFETLFIPAGIWAAFLVIDSDVTRLFVNSVVRSLLIFAFAWAVYKLLGVITGVLLEKVSRTETMLDDYLIVFMGKVFKIIVITVGIIMILQEWGYNVTTLIAGLGVGGLAIALAGQKSVENVFGFLMIFLDRVFVVGDWIATPDIEGVVEDIGMRSTKVRTFDRALVTIPNSILAGGKIINWSKADKRRINFILGVTYSSTVEQMERLSGKIYEMLEEDSRIDNTDIWVYFTNFGDSSLDILLNFFTEKPVTRKEYHKIRHDINLKIMGIVEETGMSVAFPSRSIYLENFESQMSESLKNLKNFNIRDE